MKNLKLEYRNLEMRVLSELRDKINKSRKESKHVQEKCIKVNVSDYTELVILHDELTFLDNNGQCYSIWSDCTLEDLIDILNK